MVEGPVWSRPTEPAGTTAYTVLGGPADRQRHVIGCASARRRCRPQPPRTLKQRRQQRGERRPIEARGEAAQRCNALCLRIHLVRCISRLPTTEDLAICLCLAIIRYCWRGRAAARTSSARLLGAASSAASDGSLLVVPMPAWGDEDDSVIGCQQQLKAFARTHKSANHPPIAMTYTTRKPHKPHALQHVTQGHELGNTENDRNRNPSIAVAAAAVAAMIMHPNTTLDSAEEAAC